MTIHNVLNCAHTLYMNYIVNFLVPQLEVTIVFFLLDKGQSSKQNHNTNNFVKFHNHSILLAMIYLSVNPITSTLSLR